MDLFTFTYFSTACVCLLAFMRVLACIHNVFTEHKSEHAISVLLYIGQGPLSKTA